MMKKSVKITLGALTTVSLGLGIFAAAAVQAPAGASAAEGSEYYYYVNVGAENYSERETALGLGAGTKQTGGASDQAADGWGYTAGTAGANEAEAETVFGSYRTGAAYEFTLDAGDYQVALLLEGEATSTVNGAAVEDGETGRRVVSAETTLASGKLTLSVTGNLYGIMVAAKESKILMHAEWTEGQVVVYGNLLETELQKGSTGYYSDGSKEGGVIDYDSIPAYNGVNLNFNAVTATGVVRGTGLKVTRHLIAMPENLVYFINAGSATGIPASEWTYSEADENDPNYNYNLTYLDFYGDKLINKVPDQNTTKSSTTQWGCYTAGYNTVRKGAAYSYPFNTGRVTSASKCGEINVGYRLTGLTSGQKYTMYVGTMTYWHQRTVRVTINDSEVGLIPIAARGVTVYENVTCDSSGVIDLYMIGGGTNEAICQFIALEKVEDAPEAIPADVESITKTVGLEDTALTLKNVQEGAKVQIYNSERPFNLLYEEIAVEENFAEDGSYTLDYKTPLQNVSTFYVTQMTNGGMCEAYLVSVTDIQNFTVRRSVDGYTTGNILLTISAQAGSGLTHYTVQKDFEDPKTIDLGGKFRMEETYLVKENGKYHFVVYSGLGVNYAETVEVMEIDPNRPVLTLTPTGAGWNGSRYSVKIGVTSIAPVQSYEVYLNGVKKQSGSELPSSLNLSQAGEYMLLVTNAAGQTASSSLAVGNQPVYTNVSKKLNGKVLEVTLSSIQGYSTESLSVYQIVGGSSTKLSVLGDLVYLYDEGTYVVINKTDSGATEMFRLEVPKSEFGGAASAKSGNKSFVGTIVTACILGAVGIAFILFFLLVLRKPQKVAAAEETEEAPETKTAEETPAETEGEEKAESVETVKPEVEETAAETPAEEAPAAEEETKQKPKRGKKSKKAEEAQEEAVTSNSEVLEHDEFDAE